MDAITRARDLLAEARDILHEEFLARQQIIWILTQTEGPHWLGGPVPDVEAVVLRLRMGEMLSLVQTGMVFMQLRLDHAHDLRTGLLHANKMLTQFQDMLYWDELGRFGDPPEEGLPLRSDRFPNPQVAMGTLNALIELNQRTVAELGDLLREVTTIRPPSRPPGTDPV